MRNEIIAYVRKYTAKAEKLYGRTFSKIKIDMTPRKSMVAGTAQYHLWKVWINVAIHDAKPEMLEETCAHEVAHIIARDVFNARQHDSRWRRVMIDFGFNPERTYRGNEECDLVGKNMKRYVYQCECGKELHLPKGKHEDIRYGCNITHKGCRTPLTFVRTTDKHTIAREKIAARNSQPATPVSVPTLPAAATNGPDAGQSKLAICRELYDWTESRQFNINQFIASANCTTAGAATYYAKIKRGG